MTVHPGALEIVSPDVRQSGITSHSIGVPALERLLNALPQDAGVEDYQRAAVDDNVLGLATESGRKWRFATLRRLYLLRNDSILFRALRDLWFEDADARPLLATLCALATDTVFRASVKVIEQAAPGDAVRAEDFAVAIDSFYPDVYAASTLKKIAANAYASWQQSGHLSAPEGGVKQRQKATCRAADVSYALLLGHLQGHRGEALFETLWARVLDESRSNLQELAFSASQRRMLEFRSAAGVVEVGFRQLLRPWDEET